MNSSRNYLSALAPAIIRSCSAYLRMMISRKRVLYATPSIDLAIDDSLAHLLPERPLFYMPFLPIPASTYVGWGRKPSGAQAQRHATKAGADFLLLEDGFLRSFDRADPSLSLNFDDVGVYYDAHEASRLEALINESLTSEEEERAHRIIEQWRQIGLSKYNAGSDYREDLPEDYVLVVDQVHQDASIRYGWADDASFQRMLNVARTEFPNSHIVLKVHPDVFTRAKSGHFDVNSLRGDDRIIVIAEGCLPTRLLSHARAVFTVTSQMGFEALIWNKPVYCFGMPFYAGWGLTEDDLAPPDRRSSASLEQLVFAALVRYPRYVSLAGATSGEIEDVIDHIAGLKDQNSDQP